MAEASSSSKGKAPASSNWLALQKRLTAEKTSNSRGKTVSIPKKKRKLEASLTKDGTPIASGSTTAERRSSLKTAASGSSDSLIPPTSSPSAPTCVASTSKTKKKNGAELAHLQQMVLGQLEYTPKQELPGTYLALDCEMVGVGIDGEESSLARVSLVNYHGFVVLDEYVRQRERVVDYRTQWSGIRESDMVNAKPFEEVQKRVAELLKDRILVGHAVYNDTKASALLLSHPWPMTRDTQHYAYKFGVTKSKRPALRVLVKDELGLTIQAGEHSSVTDARATMAIYRLHKKDWEKGAPHPQSTQTGKRKRTVSLEPDSSTLHDGPPPDPDVDEDNDDGDSDTGRAKGPSKKSRTSARASTSAAAAAFPGGGRKGVSSGLSTVVRRGLGQGVAEKTGKASSSSSKTTKLGVSKGSSSSGQWWKHLPGASSSSSKSGSKGSMRISG